MIVYKRWEKRRKDRIDFTYTASFEGWYLLGVLPLYIRQTSDWRRV